MKLALNVLRPHVVDIRTRIDYRTVALADNGQWLKHVIQNDSGRLLHSECAANGVETSVNSHGRVADCLASPDPLLVAPVKSADCRRSCVVAFVTKFQVARDAADIAICKVANQSLDRTRSHFRPYVHEDNNVSGGFGYTRINSDRLAALTFNHDRMDTWVVQACQQFSRSVGRAIRDDDDLLQVHIVAYCGDLGYGVARGAEMLSLMLGFGIISRLASGLIADRIGGLRTLMLGSVLQGSALLLYMMFNGLTSLYVISALFGLFQGGIIPSYAMIVREYFPAREAGTRVGLVLMATLMGMALGGWMSGAIFDLTGSYRAAFANGLGFNLLNGLIAFSLLRRRSSRTAYA